MSDLYADLKPGVKALYIGPSVRPENRGALVVVTSHPWRAADAKMCCDINPIGIPPPPWASGWCALCCYLIPLKGDPDAARKRSFRRRSKA